jgi:hypothetical protein
MLITVLSRKCNLGFYSRLGQTDKCNACTSYDSISCPAGRVFKSCNEKTHSDASCDRRCNAPDKPLMHSKYILTRLDSNLDWIHNENDMSIPNQGCLWACDDGFEAKKTLGGNWICKN